MKHCNTCNADKVESEFCKRSASKDGLSALCRECQREYDKRRLYLPHRVESRRSYQQTTSGKKASNKAKKRWLTSNPIKRSANVAVGNAVRDGVLNKPSICSECGSCGRIHGHHDDYSKPLDVRWLCSKCHSRWHRDNGEGKNAS